MREWKAVGHDVMPRDLGLCEVMKAKREWVERRKKKAQRWLERLISACLRKV